MLPRAMRRPLLDLKVKQVRDQRYALGGIGGARMAPARTGRAIGCDLDKRRSEACDREHMSLNKLFRGRRHRERACLTALVQRDGRPDAAVRPVCRAGPSRTLPGSTLTGPAGFWLY